MESIMIEQRPSRREEIQEVLEDLGFYPLFPSVEEARRGLRITDQKKQDIFNALRKGVISLEQAREAMRQLKSQE